MNENKFRFLVKKPARHGFQTLALLLALVFLLRVVFAFLIWKINGASGFLNPDSSGYLDLARSLMHGSFSTAGLPDIFRTPGYPLFLVPAMKLQSFVLAGVFENFILAVLSAWLIWRITDDLLPETSARVWAVLLYCIEPVCALHSEKLVSETLFCAQLLLFLWLLIRYLKQPSWTRLFLAALALAASTYTRPVSIYLGLGVIPLLIVLTANLSLRRRIAAGLLFVFVFGLGLLPWAIRNILVADYKGFATVSNDNLYFMSAAAVQAKLEHRSFLQVTTEWGNTDLERYFTVHPEQRTWSQAKIAAFWGKEAMRVLSRHPFLYAGIHARGCATVLFDPQVTEMLKPLRLYPEYGGLLSRSLDEGFLRSILWLLRNYPIAGVFLPLLVIQILLYYGFAISGLKHIPKQTRLVFVTLGLYFVLVSGIPAATARYRAPIMPIVCICASVAIAEYNIRRSRRTALTLAQSAQAL